MKPRRWVRALGYLALFVTVFIFTAPLVWLILGVFKYNNEHRARPPLLIGADPLGAAKQAIDYAFTGSPIPLQTVFTNSLVVATGSAVVSLALGVLAAYAFARFRFRGSLPFFILSLRMAPPIAIGLPFFLVFRQLGLIDTQAGLIVAYTTFNLPLVIWLLRAFFREMDPALEEAAIVDGASRWQALRHIALPLALPAIVSTGLLCFIFSWNEFFFAILLTQHDARTIPALLPLFQARSIAPAQPVGASFFIASMSAIPVIVLAFLLQRYLVRGLSLGAVKG